jgi:hypothetical protein
VLVGVEVEGAVGVPVELEAGVAVGVLVEDGAVVLVAVEVMAGGDVGDGLGQTLEYRWISVVLGSEKSPPAAHISPALSADMSVRYVSCGPTSRLQLLPFQCSRTAPIPSRPPTTQTLLAESASMPRSCPTLVLSYTTCQLVPFHLMTIACCSAPT